MPIAKCEVIHDILVDVETPIYVDGVEVTRQWVIAGIHYIDSDFAHQQELEGKLLIEEVDGVTAHWVGCCTDH